jgi:hypothetical protein
LEGQKFELGYRYYFGTPRKIAWNIALLLFTISVCFLDKESLYIDILKIACFSGIGFYLFSIGSAFTETMNVTVLENGIKLIDNSPASLIRWKQTVLFDEIEAIEKDAFGNVLLTSPESMVWLDKNLESDDGQTIYDFLEAKCPKKTSDGSTFKSAIIFKAGRYAVLNVIVVWLIFTIGLTALDIVIHSGPNGYKNVTELIINVIPVSFIVLFIHSKRRWRFHIIAQPDRFTMVNPGTGKSKQIFYDAIVSITKKIGSGFTIKLDGHKDVRIDTGLCLQSPTETFYQFLLKKTGNQEQKKAL